MKNHQELKFENTAAGKLVRFACLLDMQVSEQRKWYKIHILIHTYIYVYTYALFVTEQRYIPASCFGEASPIMVCVLPLPVCP